MIDIANHLLSSFAEELLPDLTMTTTILIPHTSSKSKKALLFDTYVHIICICVLSLFECLAINVQCSISFK